MEWKTLCLYFIYLAMHCIFFDIFSFYLCVLFSPIICFILPLLCLFFIELIYLLITCNYVVSVGKVSSSPGCLGWATLFYCGKY